MVIAIALIMGAGLLGYGLYQRSQLRASQAWPQTTATITKRSVERSQDSDGNGSYSANVAYEYVVEGVPYTGKRIGFSRHGYLRAGKAQRELDRYPLETSVPVYYDPVSPAQAVLVREAPTSYILTVSGIVIMAIGVAGILYSK